MDAMKPYKKEMNRSYTLGAFPTMELLSARPEIVKAVYIHSSFDGVELRSRCTAAGVPVFEGDRAIARVSPKENVFVVGVFEKFSDELSSEKPHILLDHPGDMGNLGTIMRTAAGFGFTEIALISPGADSQNPRTVRASMGAVFRVNHRWYSSLSEYRAEFPTHEMFTFMLNSAEVLTPEIRRPPLFTLAFGNEGAGLGEEYKSAGKSVFIPQTDAVDSLNLTIAAGIGMYIFR